MFDRQKRVEPLFQGKREKEKKVEWETGSGELGSSRLNSEKQRESRELENWKRDGIEDRKQLVREQADWKMGESVGRGAERKRDESEERGG